MQTEKALTGTSAFGFSKIQWRTFKGFKDEGSSHFWFSFYGASIRTNIIW